MIEVALTKVTEVAASPPNATVAPSTNPVPTMSMVVPPATPPLLGETLVTVGPAT